MDGRRDGPADGRTYGRTDLRTDGGTNQLIEIRGRIKKRKKIEEKKKSPGGKIGQSTVREEMQEKGRK